LNKYPSLDSSLHQPTERNNFTSTVKKDDLDKNINFHDLDMQSSNMIQEESFEDVQVADFIMREDADNKLKQGTQVAELLSPPNDTFVEEYVQEMIFKVEERIKLQKPRSMSIMPSQQPRS
jgi:hypothetical protein